jgi:hypothetical protein
MPIRINLLAEAQAAEELRRKDPVKRAFLGGCILVGFVILWAGYLQLKVVGVKAEVEAHDQRWLNVKEDYEVLKASKDQADGLRARLNALERLSTDRFLWGPTLNALQFSTVSDIHVIKLRGQQTFQQIAAIPAKTNQSGVVSHGKPASSIERTVFTINAKDFGTEAEQNYNKFREAIEKNPYFASHLDPAGGVKLVDLVPPAPDPANPGRRFMLLILECRFPEVSRNE